MTTDEFILLVNSQWERGLIVPHSIDLNDDLFKTADRAIKYGYVFFEPYTMTCGDAVCYKLTREGWVRLGELINAQVVFRD